MTIAALAAVPPNVFTPEDQALAREASRAVARLTGRGAVHVEITADADGASRQTFVLPALAVRLLTDMLAHLSAGRGVHVMPADTELTTQQAADILNVSRPYLIRLVEEGKIPHRLVGTHRRIKLQEILDYRAARDARSNNAMQELADEAQELGLGY